MSMNHHRRVAKPEPRTLLNGGLWQPRSEETNHVLRVGGTGSGKTVTGDVDKRNIYLRVRHPLVGGDPPRPEVVGGIEYDDKVAIIPKLCALVGEDRVLRANPWDRGAIAPNLPAMFNTEARQSNLAEILLEWLVAEKDPFWIQAAQDCLIGVAKAFEKRSRGRWDLIDLIHGTATTDRLRFIFRQLETTRYLGDAYLASENIANGVLATIRSRLRDFKPVAAVWDRTPRKINVADLVRHGGHILVLQPSEDKRRATRATNRMFMITAMETALTLDDDPWRRVVFGLDEVQELGNLHLLPRVLTNGRSKGCCVYMYTQTLDGLLKEYGESDTHKMLEMFGTLAIFRVEGRTARWAADLFGDLELRRLQGEGEKQWRPRTEAEQFVVSRALYSSEFSNLRPPSPESGLPGIYKNRYTRPYFANIVGLDRLMPWPLPGIRPFDPRPESDEELRPWTIADIRRLGLLVDPEDDLGTILGVSQEEDPKPRTTAPRDDTGTGYEETQHVLRLKIRNRPAEQVPET